VTGALLDPTEVSDAELKGHEQLPGGIVEFLAYALPFEIPDLEQFIE
jgi:hypothetical protein